MSEDAEVAGGGGNGLMEASRARGGVMGARRGQNRQPGGPKQPKQSNKLRMRRRRRRADEVDVAVTPRVNACSGRRRPGTA